MSTHAFDLAPHNDIISDTADVDPRGVRFSPALKELAFACWIECHGNAGRARQLLGEECRARAGKPGIPDQDQLPSVRAIQRWARNDGWELRFTEAVAGRYQHTLDLLTARLIRMGDQALDTIDDLTRPGYTPTKEEKIKLDAARHVTTLLGIGTAGAKLGPATLAARVAGPDEAKFTSAAEANRHWISGGSRDE